MSASSSVDPAQNLTARLFGELLQWRDGIAMVRSGLASIAQIAEAYGTPLYLYDVDILLRQFQRLRDALPQAIDIYYSIKANPHPAIVRVFVGQGAGCEIASGGEYVIARRAGVPPIRIVFAGPGKGRDELEFVVAHGVGEIHLESFDEIEILDEVTTRLKSNVAVAIRVNPSKALGGGLLMGGQPTAFGFDEGSLRNVVRLLSRCPRLMLKGVHLYTGTQILDADVLIGHWQYAVDVARQVSDLADTPLSTIDLGGGLGIPYFAHEKELDLDRLRVGAHALMVAAHADPRLARARFVVEPGRFLVGPAGIYVAAVRSVKSCRDTTFVVLDGGMNHNLAASGNLGQVVRRDYPIVNLSRVESCLDSGSRMPVVVVGPLCTPIDTLGRSVRMERPLVGDLLGILQSGAYGLTASPASFLSHPTPAEVLITGGKHECITPRGRPFEGWIG